MPFNYMDITVVVIIAFFAVWGFKRGFVKSIVGILSLAASLLLAWMLYPIISQLLETVGVKTAIFESIQNVLYEHTQGDNISSLPKFLQAAAAEGQRDIIDSTALGAAKMVLDIISFIAVLILSRIIIWIAQKFLIVLSEMPIVGLLNRVAGLLFGAAQGALIVFIVFTLIYAISPLSENIGIVEAVNTSVVAKPLYDANPIVDIFDLNEDSAEEYDTETENQTQNGD